MHEADVLRFDGVVGDVESDDRRRARANRDRCGVGVLDRDRGRPAGRGHLGTRGVRIRRGGADRQRTGDGQNDWSQPLHEPALRTIGDAADSACADDALRRRWMLELLVW
jgi:hypothetical protein